MATKKIVDPRCASNPQYGRVLKKIEATGVCPFCPQGSIQQQKILFKFGSWFITKNLYSYQGAKDRFIIVSDKHMESFSELSVRDFYEVQKNVNWAIEKYHIRGAALCLRFGDTKYTGATVCHLHFHLISAKLSKKGKPIVVQFPIG